jgi:hypothetical protein
LTKAKASNILESVVRFNYALFFIQGLKIMQEVTSKGRAEPVTRTWFRARYGQNFPDLLEEDKNDFLDNCIESVYAMFYGVADLWSDIHDRTTYVEKTQLCYGLLIAWYITDLFPDYAVGVISSGGIPIKSKAIGGVKIQFSEQNSSSSVNADLLASLKSNAFGAKAYMMIKTSGKINLFNKR